MLLTMTLFGYVVDHDAVGFEQFIKYTTIDNYHGVVQHFFISRAAGEIILEAAGSISKLKADNTIC